MRADAEHLKAQIAESLSLLRAHLDWDRAVRRLEELNARSEDPSLWDKPAEAQAVMRERGRLADQVQGVTRLETEVRDSLDLIDLAEAENDAATADAAMCRAWAPPPMARNVDSATFADMVRRNIDSGRRGASWRHPNPSRG